MERIQVGRDGLCRRHDLVFNLLFGSVIEATASVRGSPLAWDSAYLLQSAKPDLGTVILHIAAALDDGTKQEIENKIVSTTQAIAADLDQSR